MKRTHSFLIGLLTVLMLLCGCASPNEEMVDIGAEPVVSPAASVPQEAQLPEVTPQPHMDTAATPAPGVEHVPTDIEDVNGGYGTSARVDVKAAVAYAFPGEEGGTVTLYGAVEYQNTGDCPVKLSEATFTFTHAGGTTEHSFTPSLSSYEVLLPGESGFVTLFHEGISGPIAGEQVSLTASLRAEKAFDERILMRADHIYLADNYPGLTTMTGTLTLTQDAECEMNMVYVGFYDEEDTLLGVWNFTKSARFEGFGDTKNFTVHMRALPIDDLAERTASTKAVAFGFR